MIYFAVLMTYDKPWSIIFTYTLKFDQTLQFT